MLVWITRILCRWIWHLVDAWVCFCSLVQLTDQSWLSWVLTSMFAGDILRVIYENLLVSFAWRVLWAIPPGLLVLCFGLLWWLSCSLNLMGMTWSHVCSTAAWVVLASEVLAGVNAIMQISDWLKQTRVSPACGRILNLSTAPHLHERLGIRARVLLSHAILIAHFQGAHSQYLKVILK